MQLAYPDGHDALGDASVLVPTQGFNVFASVTQSGEFCSCCL